MVLESELVTSRSQLETERADRSRCQIRAWAPIARGVKFLLEPAIILNQLAHLCVDSVDSVDSNVDTVLDIALDKLLDDWTKQEAKNVSWSLNSGTVYTVYNLFT